MALQSYGLTCVVVLPNAEGCKWVFPGSSQWQELSFTNVFLFGEWQVLRVSGLLVCILLSPGDPNSAPCACEASTLPTKAFSHADLVCALCLCLLIAIAKYLMLGNTWCNSPAQSFGDKWSASAWLWWGLLATLQVGRHHCGGNIDKRGVIW